MADIEARPIPVALQTAASEFGQRAMDEDPILDRGNVSNRRAFIIRTVKAPKDAEVVFKRNSPLLDGIGSRSVLPEKVNPWRRGKDGKILTMASRKKLDGKVSQETDILNSYWGWRGIIEPEYDLLEAYTILDTEALWMRAISRMQSLAFRNGVHVVGEEPNYVTYLNDRLAQIGYVMRKGFNQWLKDVIRNLWICSNCIVSKVRDIDNSGGVQSERNGNKLPVAAYAIIPPHTIFPYLDGHGHIEKWRRFYKDGRPYRDYLPEDVIHFKWDVKPGHIFGTPRIACVRDDIFALRRLEENVELLLINHLFPLFHVQVGTEKEPVEYLPDGSSEIDYIRAQIMSMPKEGVFITDHRAEVSVVGAEGKGVDPAPMLEHYLNRTMIGMGVSGVDLGMTDTSNRSTSDTVSQNLKELIKSDLSCFSDMVQMEIFLELFQESRIKMSVQKAVATTNLDFGEIDVDGQIKLETHALNAFQSHAIDQDELRKRFRSNPLSKDQLKKMHYQMHMVDMEKVKGKIKMEQIEAQHGHEAKMQTQGEKHQAKMAEKGNETQLKTAAVSAASIKKTKITKKSASGSSTTRETHEPTSHAKKALSNLVQPENQHGKNLDPHSARSSEDPDVVQVIYDALLEIRGNLLPADGSIDAGSWRTATGVFVDKLGLDSGDSASLKNSLAQTFDEDMIWATLCAAFPPIVEVDEETEVKPGLEQISIEECLAS